MWSNSLARQVLESGNAIAPNWNGGYVSYWHKSQFKCSVTDLELMKKIIFVNWGFNKAKCVLFLLNSDDLINFHVLSLSGYCAGHRFITLSNFVRRTKLHLNEFQSGWFFQYWNAFWSRSVIIFQRTLFCYHVIYIPKSTSCRLLIKIKSSFCSNFLKHHLRNATFDNNYIFLYLLSI